jgi:acyl-CoA synthetase (NDP forming)
MDVVKKNNINLVGPNCLGVLNQDFNFDGTFNSTKLEKPNFGNISVISQSGALGSAILDVAKYESLGINKFVSYGNALDVDECDLLEYLNTDKKTEVIISYIEGVRDGRLFFETLKRVSKNKKVIIIKGGISTQGSSAAKSHTAAIAGSSKIFASAVKQAGAYLVDSMDELFDLAKLFSIYNTQELKNIQLITNGGGFGVLCVDQLSKNNIIFTKISPTLKSKLKTVLPGYAVISNPLDLTGDANSERIIDCLNICNKSKCVDSIALLLLFQLPGIDDSIIPKLIEFRKKTKKPLFVLGIGGKSTSKNLKILSENKIVCFKDPKNLSNALKYLKNE